MEYRKGFVAAADGQKVHDVPSGWSTVHLNGWTLWTHPDTPLHCHQALEDRQIAVCGDIFVAHGERSLDEVLARYAHGDDEVLDEVSGKFAILVVDRDGMRVVQDPIGSQTVFYWRKGPIVGSHAALVAGLAGARRSSPVVQYMGTDDYKAKTTRFLPGDYSLFQEVYLLIPNNELSLPSMRTRRYWPRRPVEETGADAAESVWREYFANYAEFIKPRYTLAMGLTGGTDSRSIIASLRAHDVPMRYLTWTGVKDDEKRAVEAAVEHLGGPHQWIDKTKRSSDPVFKETLLAARSAAGFTRGTPLLPVQNAEGAKKSDLFIFGHGSGIMRGSWSMVTKSWLPEDRLQRAFALYGGPARLKASEEYKKFTLSAYKGFFDRGNYDADLHGVDIGDLLYWESRMANWAALQIATFDIGMNAHAGLNSRLLYETFWGVADEGRYSKDLNRSIMQAYDAGLAGIA